MVSDVRKAYDLVLESYDVYLDSITLEMLLDCAQNSSKGREFLAERLGDESKRLLIPVAKIA